MNQQIIQIGLDYIFLQWIITAVGVIGLLFVGWYFLVKRSQFVLALLNVSRNKRRSLITLLSIIVAVCANVLYGTYFLRMFDGLRESTINSQTGHLQLMRTDYYEKGSSNPTEYLMDNSDEILEVLKSDGEFMQYVKFITTQNNFLGLITAGDRSINFMGTAVESTLDKEMSSGDLVAKGKSLDEDFPYGIMLGEGLATQLGVTVGNGVTVLSTLSGGGMNALDAEVRGIVRPFSKDYGNVLLKADRQFAWDMLYSEGVNKIIMLLNDTEETEKARVVLQKLVNNNPEWGVVVYDWYELQDFYRQVVGFFSNIFTIVSVMLFFMVIFLVLNTMSMSVFERFSEFGTLRSIGLKKYQLIEMVLAEGVILGFVGTVLGLIVAYLIGTGLTPMDIMLAPPPGQARGYPLNLTPFLNGEGIKLMIISMLSAIGVSFISSYVPAHKATRMKIIDCIRH